MVDKPVEWTRGISPPQLVDLDPLTEKSAPVMHGDSLWANTSRREKVMWSIAAVLAIILGALPALWINRWREAPPPRVEAAQPATADGDEADPAEAAAAPAPDEPAAADEPATVAPTITPAGIKANKPTRKHVKQPPRVRKPPQPAPCNVYLHPKGCPH